MTKTLAKEIGTLDTEFNGTVWSLRAGAAEGWILQDPSGVFTNRTYFDLAGLSKEDKTLIFKGAAVTDMFPPGFNPAAVGNGFYVTDVMSSVPLSDTDVSRIVFFGNSTEGALTFDQTIYMRRRVFNIDVDNQGAGLCITMFDSQLGSLEPTASDRVYCTRIVQAVAGVPTVGGLYPVRYILSADAKEEPEYEYLMRLKRSYELQNEPDRD